MWQILESGGLFVPPICEQPRKGPSWIGLKLNYFFLSVFHILRSVWLFTANSKYSRNMLIFLPYSPSHAPEFSNITHVYNIKSIFCSYLLFKNKLKELNAFLQVNAGWVLFFCFFFHTASYLRNFEKNYFAQF